MECQSPSSIQGLQGAYMKEAPLSSRVLVLYAPETQFSFHDLETDEEDGEDDERETTL